jgi:hypothetical protein
VKQQRRKRSVPGAATPDLRPPSGKESALDREFARESLETHRIFFRLQMSHALGIPEQLQPNTRYGTDAVHLLPEAQAGLHLGPSCEAARESLETHRIFFRLQMSHALGILG